MNPTREKPGILWSSVGLLLVGICALALGQQTPAEKPNELVVGKLVYVAPMPDDLDQWIIDFLRHWGKYKVTGNPEGWTWSSRPPILKRISGSRTGRGPPSRAAQTGRHRPSTGESTTKFPQPRSA